MVTEVYKFIDIHCVHCPADKQFRETNSGSCKYILDVLFNDGLPMVNENGECVLLPFVRGIEKEKSNGQLMIG